MKSALPPVAPDPLGNALYMSIDMGHRNRLVLFGRFLDDAVGDHRLMTTKNVLPPLVALAKSMHGSLGGVKKSAGL